MPSVFWPWRARFEDGEERWGRPSPRFLNVLLAEDNPVNQEVALGLLETLDCAVTVVENGKEAVDAVAHCRFDLVLMDCQMPVMDGLDATRAIRQRAIGDQQLPIVALTASTLERDRNACLDAGMDGFLNKPFTRGDLAALLQRWRSVPKRDLSPASDAAPMPKNSSIDPASIEALAALDPDGERGLVGRAITKFITYSDEVVVRITEAVERADVAELSRLTHSMKSSSANLGAIDLAEHCRTIERLTADGRLPDDIEPRLAALREVHQVARRDLLALNGNG